MLQTTNKLYYKVMIKKILIVLTILMTSCGYQPIYLNKNIKNFDLTRYHRR